MYNTALRALEMMGLADAFGSSRVPLYVLNVTYPLVDAEFIRFAEGSGRSSSWRKASPSISSRRSTRSSAAPTSRQGARQGHAADGRRIHRPGDEGGLRQFVRSYHPALAGASGSPPGDNRLKAAQAALDGNVHGRPPSFCTGCPERPIFTAMKLVERELGQHHVSCDIGCHLFSILPPFNIGATTMGYGLGGAGASAFNVKGPDKPSKRPIAIMGDGGFWHNGLASSIGNAAFNKSDGVIIVVDNGYSAATGGQDILSSHHPSERRSTQNKIETAVRGVGVDWVRTLTRTYDLKAMTATLREALTTSSPAPR